MGICDVPGIEYVCDQAGEAAASLVAAPFDWLATAMGATTSWLFQQLWSIFESTTMVDVTHPGYQRVYGLVFGVAVMVMLVFYLLQLLMALIRREPGALMRAVTGVGKSVLGSFLILTLTGLLLEATDQVCVGLVHAAGLTIADMGDRIATLLAGITVLNIAAPGVGAIVTIFLAGLAISSALVVWFSLLIRKALLLIAIVFGPFAVTGYTWDTTRGWFGKWAAFVIGLILSKLVLVVTLLIGVTLTGSPLEPDLQSISEPVTGVVLLLISAFAPYMAYKFISFMGADMYQLMSTEQEAKQAVNRPIPTRPTPTNPPATLPDPGTSGGGNSSGGGGPTPPPTPSPSTGGGGPSGTGSGGTGSASTGAGATGSASGAGAGAGAGGAAAGAPVILAASAATAGPKMGTSVGNAADTTAGAATPTPPPPPSSAPMVTRFTPTPRTPPPDTPSTPVKA